MKPDDTPAAKPATPLGGFGSRLILLVLVVVFILLVWRLADVLLILFGALVLATALLALAAPLEKHLRLSSRIAVILVVLLLITIATMGSWLIGARLADQLTDLQQSIPQALAALRDWLDKHPGGALILRALESAREADVPWSKVASAAKLTLGLIGTATLMAFLGVYLAVDPGLYRRGFLLLIAPSYRPRIDDALRASSQALSQWLLGQGISMLFVGTATTLGLALLGIPLALSLGVIAGVLAFIPFFGPIISGLLAILFAFTQGPQQALYVAGLSVLIQQLEGNVLMPFVQKWAVDLPPVLGIIAGVVFGVLFGVIGVIFATPLMVVVMVLIQKLYVERMEE